MSEDSTIKTDEDILKNFIKYWNDWHKQWYNIPSNKTLNESQKNIKDWKVPEVMMDYSGTINIGTGKEKFRNEEYAVYKAIPEPYWIHKDIISNPVKLLAVFMNINPGPSKFYHLNSNTVVPKTKTNLFTKYKGEENNNEIIPEIDWFKEYKGKKYSEFISSMIDKYNKLNISGNFWHNKNRVIWLNEHPDINKSKLKNIATFELIPWHTNNVNDIKSDWYNYESIIANILQPAIHLSKKVKGPLNNKIISRGKRNKWNDVFNKMNEEILKDTLLEINRIEFAKCLIQRVKSPDYNYNEWSYKNYNDWKEGNRHTKRNYKNPSIYTKRRDYVDDLKKKIENGKINADDEIKNLTSGIEKEIWSPKIDIATFGFDGASSLYYTTIWYNPNKEVYFINFSGPQTMELPKLNDSTSVISKTKKGNIIDFLENIKDWL
ncbi:hypothetical protein OAE89_01425 [Crocinitomicaceae bacterium]|nr:hypothetical protein [Crocinitomicaceae bacterium]